MFDWPILDVVIGLAFVFLIFSVLSSWIIEFFASILNSRSEHMVNIIQNLLNQEKKSKPENETKKVKQISGVKKLKEKPANGLSSIEKLKDHAIYEIYNHPIIKSLSKPKKLPSYISSKDFSETMFDIMENASKIKNTGLNAFRAFEETVNHVENDAIKKPLQIFLATAERTGKDIEEKISLLKSQIENWFDSVMDRASGWYKRKIQKISLAIGIALAISLNVDAIHITEVLWTKPEIRKELSQMAEKSITNKPLDEVKDELLKEFKKNYSTQPDKLKSSVKHINMLTNKAKQINDIKYKTLVLPIGWKPVNYPPYKEESNKAKKETNKNQSSNPDLKAGLGKLKAEQKNNSKKNIPKKSENKETDIMKYFSYIWLLKYLGWLISGAAISMGAPFWFDALNKLVPLRFTGKKPGEGPGESKKA